MGDLLALGSGWLERQRHQHMTRRVTYRRGGDAVELMATVGRTQFERDDGVGFVVESQVRDYLVRSEDLVLDGSTTLPARGDRIEELEEGRTYVYEVLPLAGEPPWRYSDPFRQTLRIHTRHIDEE